MNKLQALEQIRRALQLLCAGLSDEQATEVAAVFDTWKVKKPYTAGERVVYGKNEVGDPQLYKVVQDHLSKANWTPDIATSLYDAIGLDSSGHPIWSPPSGAHDAYNTGDIVNYNGELYQSLIDGNIYTPDQYPTGWQKL